MKIKPNPTLPPLGKKVLLKCLTFPPYQVDNQNPKDCKEKFLGLRMPHDKGGYYYHILDLPMNNEKHEVIAWQEVPKF